MTIKMKDVRALLEQDEINYSKAATLGPEALPFLDKLVGGTNVMLSSKAAYLASLIDDNDAVGVIQHAAAHDDPVVRVAAAAATKNIAEKAANSVLLSLMADTDTGVRKVAVQNIPDKPSRELKDKVQAASFTEADPSLQEVYGQTLERIGGSNAPSPNEDDDSGENDGMGLGGGEFDIEDTSRDTTEADFSESSDTGIGGGELPDPDNEALQGFDEDIDGYGGGDGMNNISSVQADLAPNTDRPDATDGFGGGSF